MTFKSLSTITRSHLTRPSATPPAFRYDLVRPVPATTATHFTLHQYGDSGDVGDACGRRQTGRDEMRRDSTTTAETRCADDSSGGSTTAETRCADDSGSTVAAA